MKNVRLLDCTLRDGGRVIDCKFPNQEIKDISNRLADAKIDIIEIGFIRDGRLVNYVGNSTFFTDVDQIRPYISKRGGKVLYVAFVDFGMCDIDSLKPYDGTSIDGIRFGFTKKNYKESYEEVIRWAKVIREKGYRLFIQGVNSLNYSDFELLELVQMVNEIKPYSFGIVDTYGAMYLEDVDRIYRLIDNNMNPDICINFHSHNNYQLSFALAQEVIKLSGISNRKVIIDGTLGGMGKVAGNLNTELIVDYLVRKMNYDYEFEDILDILDDYIYKYSLNHKWGYSTAAMMAGVYKAHPNNIIYLTEKYRLDTKDIGEILSMIKPEERQRYNYENIEHLYTEYVADKIDDKKSIAYLKQLIEGREVLVLAPGNSINRYKRDIDVYVAKNKPIILSVNFVSNYSDAFVFFGNSKRYARLKTQRKGKKVIVSSNIKSDDSSDLCINYHTLINRGHKYFENSTIMLFALLKRLSPYKIAIAGFDGFKENESNYVDDSYQNERHIDEFTKLNLEIKEMFREVEKKMEPDCKFVFLTPSLYQK